MREFIAILSFDEDKASEFDEVNGREEAAPGDYLEREMRHLEERGVQLGDWALVDYDVPWEQYLRYVAQWTIEHDSDDHIGSSPLQYHEWLDCARNGGMT